MKKICIALSFAMLFVPVASFAATTTTAGPITATNGQLISTLSNKVTLIASAGGNAYAAVSGHESGSKVYASTSGVTKIYQQVSDPVTVSSFAPSTSDTAQYSGGSWVAM